MRFLLPHSLNPATHLFILQNLAVVTFVLACTTDLHTGTLPAVDMNRRYIHILLYGDKEGKVDD